MAKRIVITGGAGFLGRSLIAECQRWEVTSIDQVNWSGIAPGWVNHKVVDVTDMDAMRQAIGTTDIVFLRHGVVGGATSVDVARCNDYLRVNAEAVINALDICTNIGCARVILDSSEQVFGTSGDLSAQTPYVEPSACNFYGVSKLAAEKAVQMWAAAAPERSTQIFRYSRVRSPMSRDVIFHMISSCVMGKPIKIVGNAGHRVSFVHIDDVIAANLKAMERSPRTAIYNISCDRPISLFELAQRVQAHVGVRVLIEFIESKAPAFEPFVVGMSWEDSARELGIQPRYNLDDMIRQTVDQVRGS